MKNLSLFILMFVNLICVVKAAPQKNEKEVSFRDKIFFNGNIGLALGSVTQIEISPGVGYKFTDKLALGLGVNYIYSSNDSITPKISQSVLGPRVFVMYNLLDQIYLTSKYEYLSYKISQANVQVKKDIPAWFVGAGYRLGSNRIGFSIEFLYDVLYNENESLASEPYKLQAGVNIGF